MPMPDFLAHLCLPRVLLFPDPIRQHQYLQPCFDHVLQDYAHPDIGMMCNNAMLTHGAHKVMFRRGVPWRAVEATDPNFAQFLFYFEGDGLVAPYVEIETAERLDPTILERNCLRLDVSLRPLTSSEDGTVIGRSHMDDRYQLILQEAEPFSEVDRRIHGDPYEHETRFAQSRRREELLLPSQREELQAKRRAEAEEAGNVLNLHKKPIGDSEV